ncbi:uncharacterized protein LOC131438288 isoform X2 [Malaya genurostris]|uniref:uncharacterized protein LOC131438288 isoform X2 n=1 Tax=Malaya genurostris TaxID=325434 RepID=UPI0026F3F166|nr:uncharacterized protein LOC131438288 isoform X2 [Malaya genurostris]
MKVLSNCIFACCMLILHGCAVNSTNYRLPHNFGFHTRGYATEHNFLQDRRNGLASSNEEGILHASTNYQSRAANGGSRGVIHSDRTDTGAFQAFRRNEGDSPYHASLYPRGYANGQYWYPNQVYDQHYLAGSGGRFGGRFGNGFGTHYGIGPYGSINPALGGLPTGFQKNISDERHVSKVDGDIRAVDSTDVQSTAVQGSEGEVNPKTSVGATGFQRGVYQTPGIGNSHGFSTFPYAGRRPDDYLVSGGGNGFTSIRNGHSGSNGFVPSGVAPFQTSSGNPVNGFAGSPYNINPSSLNNIRPRGDFPTNKNSAPVPGENPTDSSNQENINGTNENLSHPSEPRQNVPNSVPHDGTTVTTDNATLQPGDTELGTTSKDLNRSNDLQHESVHPNPSSLAEANPASGGFLNERGNQLGSVQPRTRLLDGTPSSGTFIPNTFQRESFGSRGFFAGGVSHGTGIKNPARQGLPNNNLYRSNYFGSNPEYAYPSSIGGSTFGGRRNQFSGRQADAVNGASNYDSSISIDVQRGSTDLSGSTTGVNAHTNLEDPNKLAFNLGARSGLQGSGSDLVTYGTESRNKNNVNIEPTTASTNAENKS